MQSAGEQQGESPREQSLFTMLLRNDVGSSLDHVALLAPGRTPLTYRDLSGAVLHSSSQLAGSGIKRHDRVGMVLPNSPEAITAFLAVSEAAVCAPFNPSYSVEEFKFYLSDLGARIVIIADGLRTQAFEAAKQLGVEIITLTTKPASPAGTFELDGLRVGAHTIVNASKQDVALVLHTSGTTGRPKIVPLAHSNIAVSARNIAASLSLQRKDLCLNPMPLFHVHGLIGGALSTLASGGSILCPEGFDPEQFWTLLKEYKPTWYTGVPTMHQSILAVLGERAKKSNPTSLRFIRSSSAALSSSVARQLEEAFHVPVIEAYGMTEAAHQIAINPFPPESRKPGSVGREQGCRVAVMDAAGNLLPDGQTGEIVIRGDNVITGYENNPKANENSFVRGWFRTGDQGYRDSDGYIILNGRLKELINRGGEKISPREIDEVLLRHPAVVEAVAFSFPHASLGEDIGAVVVLREGMDVAERELRQFSSLLLAPHKIPRVIVKADVIPKGPTGKVQRVSLAKILGISEAKPMEQKETLYSEIRPETPLELELLAIWSKVLNLDTIETNADFFSLGGSSIDAMRIISAIRDKYGFELQFTDFFSVPTVKELACLLEQHVNA